MAGKILRVGLFGAFMLILTLIGAGLYVFSVATSDSLKFQLGDPAYYIIVASRTVSEFPRFSASEQAVDFTYSARDGTAPGQITMTYASAAAAQDLDRSHRAYCEAQGYGSVPEDGLFLDSRLGCEAPDYRIEVGFRPREQGSLVTVDFLER